MKRVLPFALYLLPFAAISQTITQRLQKAFLQFESDSQLKHAISSLYVIDAKTGQVVFNKNSQVGLAPASTQKIITSVTAFELLGKEYRYKTEFGFGDDVASESLSINPSGDPTLGSWRWQQTTDSVIYEKILAAVEKSKIKHLSKIVINIGKWEDPPIPDGWIMQDVGNYYGAPARFLNWRENQFDVILKSGNKVGDIVQITRTSPKVKFIGYSDVTSAPRGSGDNAYVYFPVFSTPDKTYIIRGTIPVNEDNFVISASMPSPENNLVETLIQNLKGKMDIEAPVSGKIIFTNTRIKSQPIYNHYSPSLDSIIYWFNKKSINLYGEALIKTFAYEKQGFGSTDSGVAIVKKFWKQKGLDEDELNIYDGSGLSPLNRVTTHAQVEILKYAKSKDWFPYFYNSLPEYNGMKIKSGTISDVKGFCGYHRSKDGREYIFSFLVNNYIGKSSALVGKMYKVLDVLK